MEAIAYSKRFKVGSLKGWGRRTLFLVVELRKKEEGVTLSICGDVMAGGHCVAGGQCLDALDEIENPAISRGKIREIRQIWQVWHLNDLNAGCQHQKAMGWGNESLSKPCPTCGYKYGTAWLFEPLPEYVIEKIKGW